MGIVANVLNQYDSFCIIARTIFESKMKYSLLNISLVSSFTKFHNIFDMTAAFNSALTTNSFFRFAILPLAGRGLLSNLPFHSFHLIHAHAPKACLDASLDITRPGLSIAPGGLMHVLKEILILKETLSMANNS